MTDVRELLRRAAGRATSGADLRDVRRRSRRHDQRQRAVRCGVIATIPTLVIIAAVTATQLADRPPAARVLLAPVSAPEPAPPEPSSEEGSAMATPPTMPVPSAVPTVGKDHLSSDLDPAPPPVAAPAPSPSSAAAPHGELPVWVAAEAESGSWTAGVERGEDPQAAGGAFLVVVEEHVGGSEGNQGTARIDLAIDVAATADYVLWARVLAPDIGSNSFHLSIDGGPDRIWHVPGPTLEDVATEWTWARSGDATASNQTVALSAGPHVVSFRNREDDTALDRIVLTTDPATSPVGRFGFEPASPP